MRACRKQPTDCTPVWFMRQVGRYLPEYCKLREKYGFLELCKNPELAAEVTLMPMRRFPLDAAIIFADLMTPLEAAGVKFELCEGISPIIEEPIRSPKDVENLFVPEADEIAPETIQAIHFVKSKLNGIALIGFVVEGKETRDFTLSVPRIHFGTGTAALLTLMKEAGGEVIGLDWRVHLDEAWQKLNFEVAIQGNPDPATLLGPFEFIKERTLDILKRAGRRAGHILNLGHGILPQTDPDNVAQLVDLVHSASQQMLHGDG